VRGSEVGDEKGGAGWEVGLGAWGYWGNSGRSHALGFPVTCGVSMLEPATRVSGFGFPTSRPAGSVYLPISRPMGFIFNYTLLHLMRVPVGLAGVGYPLTSVFVA
jgi:hypothetical protein